MFSCCVDGSAEGPEIVKSCFKGLWRVKSRVSVYAGGILSVPVKSRQTASITSDNRAFDV